MSNEECSQIKGTSVENMEDVINLVGQGKWNVPFYVITSLCEFKYLLS